MEIDPKKYWGVITGDFIGFSDLDVSVRRRMPQVMVDAGKDLCRALGPIMPWDADVFRGDGWQVLVADPAGVLRAALFFRAYIIAAAGDDGVDTRMAIGIGPVDYVPDGNIAAGDGGAYRASGNLLEKMDSSRHGRLRLGFANPLDALTALGLPDEALMDALVRVAGALADRWRSRRARAVVGALKGWPQARIAESWPTRISRQAVGKHLEHAGWHAIAHAVAVFEDKMACLNPREN